MKPKHLVLIAAVALAFTATPTVGKTVKQCIKQCDLTEEACSDGANKAIYNADFQSYDCVSYQACARVIRQCERTRERCRTNCKKR